MYMRLLSSVFVFLSRTVNSESGNVGAGSGLVFGGANVVAGVSGGYGRDHEHAHAIRDFFYQDTRRATDTFAGVRPADLERQVADRDDALEIRKLTGVHG